MLIQSTFADEVLLAVTAPEVEGVKGLEVLVRCGLNLEGFLTFATLTVPLGTLMILKGR